MLRMAGLLIHILHGCQKAAKLQPKQRNDKLVPLAQAAANRMRPPLSPSVGAHMTASLLNCLSIEISYKGCCDQLNSTHYRGLLITNLSGIVSVVIWPPLVTTLGGTRITI